MMRSLIGVKLNCFGSCFAASRRINAAASSTVAAAFESRLFGNSSTRCGFASSVVALTVFAEAATDDDDDEEEVDVEEDDDVDCVDIATDGGGAKHAMTSFRSRAFNSNERIVSIVL